MKKDIHPTKRMWRTLVRVASVERGDFVTHGVYLIIPGWSVREKVWCSYQAIPPVILETMKTGKRYHVGCNIGAEKQWQLCFDRWENE